MSLCKIALTLVITMAGIVNPPAGNAFQEDWESAALGVYCPVVDDDAFPSFIAADEGNWIVDATVSTSDDCGVTPHTAEIIESGGAAHYV